MALTSVLYIKNEKVNGDHVRPNRCYYWTHMQFKDAGEWKMAEELFNENSQDEFLIENDFYQGKLAQKRIQMDNPNNSMVLLRNEQDSKDLALIRILKANILWFLSFGC